MSASESRDAPPDLRTAWLAVAVWAGAWCGVTGGWALSGWGALSAAAAWAAWRWRSRLLAIAAAGVVTAGGVGALWWWANATSPLAGLARQGAVLTVSAVVTGDPVVWQPRGVLPGQTVVAVSVRRIQCHGTAYELRQAAWLVLGVDADGLAVGQRVTVLVRASWPGDTLTPQARLKALGDVEVVSPPGPVDRALNGLRAGLRAAMAHSPPDQAALVPGLVVGDTSGVPPRLVDDFRATALTHLMAVSGTNLTLMVVFLVASARAVGARGWWLRGVTVAGVVVFVALCRGEPSVLRAAAMGLMALAATGVSAEPGRGLRGWGVAVAGVCLVQPAMSHSWGFAMSACATLGILWWAPAWARSMRRWAPAWVAQAVTVPLAAQLATQPLVTALNGQVSLVGLFANLVAEPFVGPVTVLGLIACLLSPLGPPATAPGWLAGWCSQPILLVATGGSSLPGATVSWGAAQWGFTAIALLALAALCWLMSRGVSIVLTRGWTSVAALACLCAAVVLPVHPPGWPGSWSLVFCDVGQGDAAVVKVADGVGVMIDAGPDPAALSRCLGALRIKRLALIVLSHEHADHVAGAAGLAGRVGIDLVLVRAGLTDDDIRTTAALLGDPSLPVAPTWTGQVVDVGPVRWTTLRSGPLMQATPGSAEGEDPQANNASTIGRVDTEGLRILFTGDAETEEQSVLGAGKDGLRADVVKVPHHGSSRQDAGFLAATGAAIAVISVGADNDYGHPASRTVAALQGDGMRVYRTDLMGGVAIVAAAGGAVVHTQHRSPP